MNKKLIKASVAGAAALALAAGGTTFASWSDFGSISDNLGGGIMISQACPNAGSGSTALDFDNLAPGMNSFRTISGGKQRRRLGPIGEPQ